MDMHCHIFMPTSNEKLLFYHMTPLLLWYFKIDGVSWRNCGLIECQSRIILPWSL